MCSEKEWEGGVGGVAGGDTVLGVMWVCRRFELNGSGHDGSRHLAHWCDADKGVVVCCIVRRNVEGVSKTGLLFMGDGGRGGLSYFLLGFHVQRGLLFLFMLGSDVVSCVDHKSWLARLCTRPRDCLGFHSAAESFAFK